MNYFELFQIPVQLQIDQALTRRKFLEMSRKYHPDYFAQNNEEDQATALETSANLNKAYKTFSDKDATIRYVLQEKGLLEEEEKYSLPSPFLMDMMELNEALADAEIEENEEVRNTLKKQLLHLQEEIYEPVKHIVEHYQEGVTTKKELLQVKEYYFKKKYLQRIAQQMGQKL
jgi:molecular chaperone HscB